jgi:type III secretion protein C
VVPLTPKPLPGTRYGPPLPPPPPQDAASQPAVTQTGAQGTQDHAYDHP